MDITELLPRPRSLSLGGATYAVSELRMVDYADLQQWIRLHCPHPVESIKGHLEGLEEQDRRVLLIRAYEDARKWPPKVGSLAGNEALLGSHEGVVEFVRVAVGRGVIERFDSGDAERLLAALSPAEFEDLMCAAFGVDPQRVLEGLLGRPKAGAAIPRSTSRSSTSSSPRSPRGRSRPKASAS